MNIFLPLVLFILSSVTGFAQAGSNVDPKAPVIKFNSDSIDFGIVTAGEIITREFVFTNTGKQPLMIQHVISTCSCSPAIYDKNPVAPGKTSTIKVTYNTANKSGKQDKMFFVKSNNRDGEVVLHLTGIVEPNLKTTICPTVVVSDTMPQTAAKPTPVANKSTPTSSPAQQAPVIIPVYKPSPPVMPTNGIPRY